MERKDVAKELQWKTSDIFPTDEAWEAEFKAVEEEYGNFDFKTYSGKLGEKATLLECFKKMDL